MTTTPRVFGVTYQFLSCGAVFTDGLVHAAAALGVDYQHALWDVPDLQARIQRFQPQLIFVVHGRRFARGFGRPAAGFGGTKAADGRYAGTEATTTCRVLTREPAGSLPISRGVPDETDGPPLNSCPANPSTFYLSAPAGDPVVTVLGGGLSVNGVPLL